MPEPEVVMKLNAAGVGVVVRTKVEPEKAVKISPEIGSGIWAKRRSVKRMMYDYVAQSIAHVFRPRPPPSSSALLSHTTPTAAWRRVSRLIYPDHSSVAMPLNLCFSLFYYLSFFFSFFLFQRVIGYGKPSVMCFLFPPSDL
jgi:hypothetical protein